MPCSISRARRWFAGSRSRFVPRELPQEERRPGAWPSSVAPLGTTRLGAGRASLRATPGRRPGRADPRLTGGPCGPWTRPPLDQREQRRIAAVVVVRRGPADEAQRGRLEGALRLEARPAPHVVPRAVGGQLVADMAARAARLAGMEELVAARGEGHAGAARRGFRFCGAGRRRYERGALLGREDRRLGGRLHAAEVREDRVALLRAQAGAREPGHGPGEVALQVLLAAFPSRTARCHRAAP